MYDRIFSAALAFCLLAAGTLAIGSEMFARSRAPAPVAHVSVIELPMVQVTGQRLRAVAQAEATEPTQSVVE